MRKADIPFYKKFQAVKKLGIVPNGGQTLKDYNFLRQKKSVQRWHFLLLLKKHQPIKLKTIQLCMK